MARPQHCRFHHDEKTLPFSNVEYDARLAKLRATMVDEGVDACVFTSMHNVAYYFGFLYCAFGRPYALVVTQSESVTVSAGIDAAQLWRRSHSENITYTDWERNNYWRVIVSVTGISKSIGYEGDHISIAHKALLDEFLRPSASKDIAPATMVPGQGHQIHETKECLRQLPHF